MVGLAARSCGPARDSTPAARPYDRGGGGDAIDLDADSRALLDAYAPTARPDASATTVRRGGAARCV